MASLTNPQALNRYSYCINNPLKYVDPSGYLTGKVTVGGEMYTLVEDGGSKHHFVGPNGSQTASLSLAALLEMTSSYMTYIGDDSGGVDCYGQSNVVVYSPDPMSKSNRDIYMKNVFSWNGGALSNTQSKKRYEWKARAYYFPFREGNRWEGKWERYYGGGENLRDWDEICQMLADTEWGRLGDAVIGTGELVLGAPMAITGGTLTVAAIIPGAAVAEVPTVYTATMGYAGVQLCVDGINRAAGEQLIDIGWLQWPF